MIAHIEADADFNGDHYVDQTFIWLEDATPGDIAALEARGFDIEPDEDLAFRVTSCPGRAFEHWSEAAERILREHGAEVRT